MGRLAEIIYRPRSRRRGNRMSDGSNKGEENDVRSDGFAMLAVLLLTVGLIVYVGWDVI